MVMLNRKYNLSPVSEIAFVSARVEGHLGKFHFLPAGGLWKFEKFCKFLMIPLLYNFCDPT